MSFSKFISLLETESLFFAQVKVMADKYEGFLDAPPGSDMHNCITAMYDLPTSPWSVSVTTCWSAGDHESDALWRSFAPGDEGVAVCTTAEKLENAVTQVPSPLAKRIFTGLVQYRNPPQPDMQHGESCGFDGYLFYKRFEFAAEKEFRVLAHARDYVLADKMGGVFVPVDLNMLIDHVYVAPRASKWLLELVRKTAMKRMPSASVSCSTIGQHPYKLDLP